MNKYVSGKTMHDKIRQIKEENRHSSNEEIREKHIKKFNKILYNEIFVFNECNFLPFIFLSMHNFLVYKDFKPIIFDFGLQN